MSTLPEKVIRVLAPFGTLASLLRNRDKVAAGSAGKLAANDLTVVTGRGICRQWTLVAGLPVDHGEVADEAAMLALHVDSAEIPTPRWVVPGDSCTRADDPGWRWHCIAGHGLALTDWERRPLAAALSGLAVSGHTHALADVAGAAPIDSPAFTGTPTAPDPTTSAGIVPRSYMEDAIAAALGSIPGGGMILDWEWVESVAITTPVASLTLPSSGAFAAGYEYLLQFRGLAASGVDRFLARVDVGGGWITSATYTRDLSHRIAGTAGATADLVTNSTVLSLTAGTTPARTGSASGSLRLRPSAQSAGIAAMQLESTVLLGTGSAYTDGGVWLNTPINAAIQRLLVYTTANLTAGVVALYRRPI